MSLLYDIPLHLMEQIASNKASLFGAIIKDNATGQILGHVQQSSVLQQALGSLPGVGNMFTSFSPLNIITGIQNEHIRRGIAELQNGMVLVQNLQYGTLALSGLGLGVSVAGFAATIAKLKAIESRIEELSSAVQQVTRDRRDDDLRGVFADISADLQNIDTLASRSNRARVAEDLQISLTRSLRRLEMYFQREADVSRVTSIDLAQIDMLWTLAAGMRLCQDAMLRALFWADELPAAQQIARTELQHVLPVLQGLNPDRLSRLASRSETDVERMHQRRQEILVQARLLEDGLKGTVLGLAGQASIATTLQDTGISGSEYMRSVESNAARPLQFLPAKTVA